MKSEMRMVFVAVIAAICLIGAVDTGFAGSDQIDLRYEAAGIEAATCSKSVSIITFEDKREDEAIGVSGRGRRFYGRNPVNEWVTRALYDELKQTGCKVEYHDTDGDHDTDFTIVDIVEEAFIRQNSMTKYHVTMRLNIRIKQDGKQVLGKTFSSNLEQRTGPSFNFNSGVATRMLQGMMREVVPELHKQFK